MADFVSHYISIISFLNFCVFSPSFIEYNLLILSILFDVSNYFEYIILSISFDKC